MQRLAIEKEFKIQHYKLESKYEELYKPIYTKRAEVVEGTTEVSVEEISSQLEKVTLSDVNATSSEKGIPSFWLKCLKNTSQFGQDLNKKDEEILAFLKDVTCDFSDNGSFKLHFLFNPNSWFDHTVLTREFVLDQNKLTISKITSTKIDWKSEDLNPTVEKKKKKIKNSKNLKQFLKI
jgi:nucleosome assembly protein 1-like 1